MVGFAAALVLDLLTIGQGQSFYADQSIEFRPRTQASPSGSIQLTQANETEEPFVDFDEMREIFPSIVAWIQSEWTVINYPIVQGGDNDHYLYRLADGRSHIMGSIFLDYRNVPDFSDQSIIIYGHDMRSGDMFGSLRHYTDQDYFEAHSSMFIFTPEQDFELLLFSGYVIDSAYEVPPMHFADQEDFDRFVSDIKRRSIFSSDVEVSFGDQIVFLATCTPNNLENERLIIAGKLVAAP